MSNNEPTMRISLVDGRTFEATRHNTSLQQYAGELASRNHIFFVTGIDETDGKKTGMPYFRHCAHYEEMLAFMAQHEFPMHVNLIEVPETVEAAFQTTLDEDAAGEASGLDDEINKLLGDD